MKQQEQQTDARKQQRHVGQAVAERIETKQRVVDRKGERNNRAEEAGGAGRDQPDDVAGAFHLRIGNPDEIVLDEAVSGVAPVHHRDETQRDHDCATPENPRHGQRHRSRNWRMSSARAAASASPISINCRR